MKIGLAHGPLLVAVLYLTVGHMAVASAGGQPRSDPRDPIRWFIPGKYYEQVALDCVREKNFPCALDAYQKAAYWANKTAQYNVGVMYLKGVDGVPIDRPRGVAWLGIAAEQHKPEIDQVLHDAFVGLTPEEHAIASALWKQLNVDYGDDVTEARATKRFNAQLANTRATSSTTETDPSATTATLDGYSPQGTTRNSQFISSINQTGHQNRGATVGNYVASFKQQFSDYITAQFGHVDVGPVETLPSTKPH